MSDEWEVISSYSWQQGVADGFLVELFRNRWSQLSQGKPILATSHLFGEISLAGLREIWNEFVQWEASTKPTLKEEDQMFSTTMNSETIWVVDDGTVFTMMYPSDY